MTKKQKRSAVNANVRLPTGTVLTAVSKILRSVGTPLALLVHSSLERRDYGHVISLGVNHSDYTDPMSFRGDYLATEVLSKYPFNLGIDRAWEAMNIFHEGEARCRKLNVQILTGQWKRNLHPTHYTVILTAREKIRKWLGSLDLNELPESCGFGPGASFGLKRSEADVASKLLRDLQTTPGNYFLADILVKYFAGWDASLYREHSRMFHVVKGSRITTVPKDAKKDRLIAIEPGLNVYVQKGIGAMVRDRLRKAGLDLNKSWVRNQELALRGSLDGSYASLDLRMASDCISHRLTEFLLPDDWMDLVNTARSRQTLLPDGSWVTLQKVSSMGNGATFEIESMMFYALSLSVAEYIHGRGMSEHVSVFGDDIIVPRQSVHLLVDVLASCGFEVNTKKSFSEGPFRESCGMHCHGGLDVTPFYVRKQEDTVLSLIRLLNRLREWAWDFSGPYEGLREVYDELRSLLPERYRQPSIPFGYGDFALWGSFDEATPQRVDTIQRKGKLRFPQHEGWLCRVLLPTTTRAPNRGYGSVLASLYHKGRRERSTKHRSRYGRLTGRLEQLATDLEEGRIFAGSYKEASIRVHQWSG